MFRGAESAGRSNVLTELNSREVSASSEKGKRQREPTPYSHEDSKEHGAAVVKQMGHLEAYE